MHLSKMLIPCKCRFMAPQQNVQLLLAFQQPTGSEKTMTINSLQDAVVQRRSLIKCECLPKSWSQLNVGGRAIRFGVCGNFPADGTCGNRQTKPEFERERGAGSKLSSVRKKIEIQQKKRVPWNRKFVQVLEQCHSDAAVSSPCAGRIRFALNWLALFLSRGASRPNFQTLNCVKSFGQTKK